jgi:hypothetical protein
MRAEQNRAMAAAVVAWKLNLLLAGRGRQIKEQIHATDPDQENVLCVEKRF